MAAFTGISDQQKSPKLGCKPAKRILKKMIKTLFICILFYVACVIKNDTTTAHHLKACTICGTVSRGFYDSKTKSYMCKFRNLGACSNSVHKTRGI